MNGVPLAPTIIEDVEPFFPRCQSQMRRDIVFVHIPKTAGTTLRKMFEEAAANHLILRDYGDSPSTAPDIYDLVHRQKKPELFRERFKGSKGGILLSGHFPVRRYWDSFNAESFMTFVRDPVDRVLSEYNHFVTHHGWTSSIEEFVSAPQFRNTISRFLAGVELDRIGFIGVMEEFESQISALEEYAGAPLRIRRLNVGKYGAPENGTAEHCSYRTMIADLNHEDIALYEDLRRCRAKSPLAAGAEEVISESYRGRVRLVDDHMVWGWLCNSARESIAEVEIFANGKCVAVVKADRYRKDLCEKGHSRSGVGAFRVSLRELRHEVSFELPRVELSFKARGSTYELSGSPMMWGLA